MEDSRNRFKTLPGKFEVYGTKIEGGNVYFTVSVPDEAEAQLVLTDAAGKTVLEKVSLPASERRGSLSAVGLEGLAGQNFGYYYLVEGKKVLDPFARRLSDGICFTDGSGYDWKEDTLPLTPLHKTILYKLHVRGFTKKAGSSVKAKGTFRGVSEKLDYIRDLGFTAVEFMPMYEWDDTLKMTPHSYTEEKPADLPKNYWGYSEKNFYFAPKQSYSSTSDSCRELKDLIREMHARKMECIPEFFFPQGTNPMLALEAVHFWVDSYHADGFHFVGAGVPTELLIRDPYLTRTKMLFENIDADWIYGGHNPVRRNLMEYNESFMMNGRAFLKGDEGQLGSFADHVRRNRTTHEFVNYMANVNGFTLADAVSYDWKHNEKNGEDNEDGPAVNASWNCGAEGRTKKASVLALRRKQEENALSYVFLSQGVPLLYAGDEFGNSQGGNNNGYSSNNSVGWLDWNEIGKEKDLTLFVKKLIAFRKNHPILHMKSPLRESDYLSVGYPDVSFHDTKAWYCPYDNSSRSMGIMYCGLYAKKEGASDDFLYVAYNAYWDKHSFALPSLPKGMKWFKEMTTEAKSGREFSDEASPLADQRSYAAAARSVTILVGRAEG